MDEAHYRFLLVEDDDGDAELVNWALRRQDAQYSLDRVATVEECLASCRRNEFDVILLDLNLPGVHEFDGVERVSELVPRPAIIVLTGFVDPSAVEKALRAGAQGYLDKNVSVKELGRSIYAAARCPFSPPAAGGARTPA